MSEDLITMAEIARRTQVTLPAVSNWRRRHATFPRARRRDGQEFFALAEVVDWLNGRKVARNDLKPTEPATTTYGARFRNSLAEPQWEHIWKELHRHLGMVDIATYADLVLGLLYLSVRNRNEWADLLQVRAEHTERATLNEDPMLTPVRRACRSVLLTSANRSRLDHIARTIDRAKLGVNSHTWASELFEFLLHHFAAKEGIRGAVVVTPPSVARTLVELTGPKPADTVLDPCADSAGFLLEAARKLLSQGCRAQDIRLTGQAISERSWTLAQMNLDLHGVPGDFGAQPGIALYNDHPPDDRYDIVLANPPFNMKLREADLRTDQWPFGAPPRHNANFAWLQHVWDSLADGGRAAVVMSNNASFAGGTEQTIRAAMVEAGVVEALIDLPTQLFSTTGIGVTVWVLNRPGTRHDIEVLLVDARDSGRMVSQLRRDLPAEDIVQIADAVLRWRDRHTRPDYQSIPGFSRPVPIEEIRDHDYQLTPELYVGREVSADAPVESITELLNRLDRLHARAAAIDDEVTRQLNWILP